MKILFVSSAPLEYGSSSNMRNIALLKGFVDNGYKVYTLTPEPQKESALYDESICDIEIEKKYFIPLGAIHSAVTMKKNKKSKIKNYIYNIVKKFKIYDFRSDLAKREIKIEEEFDIMISSSDPKSSHLIAEKLKRNNPNITKKWIQYWGDPFADDINNKGYVPKWIIKKEEKRLISIADYVLYVSPFTQKKQQTLYMQQSEKMLFLPIPYKEPIIYEKTNNMNRKLGYFGEYYTRNRNILPLYNVCNEKNEITLNISGNSDLELKETHNINIYKRLSVKEMRELEKTMDALICICNKNGTQIPGKVYHYSATNKPIIIILDGSERKKMKEYFDSFNRFIVCENDEKSIKNVLDKLEEDNTEYVPLDNLLPKNIVKSLLEKI